MFYWECFVSILLIMLCAVAEILVYMLPLIAIGGIIVWITKAFKS